MKKLLLFIFPLMLYACGSRQEESAANAETESLTVQLDDAQLQRATLETGSVMKKMMTGRLTVSGTIDVHPQNMVNVTFPPGGFIRSSELLPGMPVRKGQELALMEDPGLIRLQQDFLTASIRDRQLEKEFKRQQELNASKTSSDKALQEAEAAYRSNRVAMRSTREQLLLAGIDADALNEDNISRSVALKSPISGYVSRVHARNGSYVNPADVLFELANPEDIHLTLNVFEKDIAMVSTGQKISAWTNAQPDKKHEGWVKYVGKDLGSERHVEVHCDFNKRDNSLLPGMFMNAEIITEAREAYALPPGALVNHGGKQYIFTEDGKGRFTMHAVGTGLKQDDMVEILPENEEVLTRPIVTKNAYTLLMQLMNREEE